MVNYVSTSDINSILGTSGEDTLINTLNGIATTQINSYLQVTSLFSATYTNEEHDLKDNIYYLNEIYPTSITSINGNSPGNYKLNGRRLQLELNPTNTETIFNKIKITYVAGFSTIPEDIKAVVYNLVGFMYNNKKANGIDEFTQGQLRVKYGANKDYYTQLNGILDGLRAYRKNNILTN